MYTEKLYLSPCCPPYILPNSTSPMIFRGEKKNEVTQSCMTLCDPMDCSLPGSPIHGTFQARVLEWIAISFSRGSSLPKDGTWVSHIVGKCFTL